LSAVLAAALVGATALAGCGDDDGDVALPAVEDIAPAVAALEASLGGPQDYFELDATVLGVTLWVAGTAADDDGATTATPYLYVGGECRSTARDTSSPPTWRCRAPRRPLLDIASRPVIGSTRGRPAGCDAALAPPASAGRGVAAVRPPPAGSGYG
jgi:hypothetical protein